MLSSRSALKVELLQPALPRDISAFQALNAVPPEGASRIIPALEFQSAAQRISLFSHARPREVFYARQDSSALEA